MVELNRAPDNEGDRQQPLLRDILAESTFKLGRSIPAQVNSLDLGVFQEEARQLANGCFQDSKNRDLGKLVFVTGKKKVLVPTHYFQGDEGGSLLMFHPISHVQKEVAGKEQLDERYLSMTIRTSGNTDLSFSSTDLYTLMVDDLHTAASVATFTAGRTKNMLFFRGQNTPQLTHEQAEKKVRLWEWQLEKRIEQFTKPGMSKEEESLIEDGAGRALLRQICKKYDLQFFSGGIGSPIVTKQTP